MKPTVAILLMGGLPVLGAFRASAVKVDITPKTPQWLMGYGPRTSTGVHDPIFHRIVAMDDAAQMGIVHRPRQVLHDLCRFLRRRNELFLPTWIVVGIDVVEL